MTGKIQQVAKRGLDVAGALALGIILSPAMIFAALAVRHQLGSPVIFRQTRYGKNAQPFTIYKFRSMHEEFNGLARREPADRLTPVTSFLRKSSLDELPQLWNVLKGDMSLVGPRPHIDLNLPCDTSHARYRMRPGITGLAQILGRNSLPHSIRVELESRYVENWSFTGDLRLLARTIPVWLTGKGYTDPKPTQPTASSRDRIQP